MLVTGYASVAELVAFVAAWSGSGGEGPVRLLFGTEPFASHRRTFASPRAAFTEEARRYWIEERGISLRQSAQLVATLDALASGRVVARFVHGATRLHSKIYIGDDAATIGSSNFTPAGLGGQLESNARFSSTGEPRRYRELKAIATNLWDLGQPWDEELRDLLTSLLRVVTWQEALARACSELLEGEWAARYLDDSGIDVELWPSQRAGIAQALWIVGQVGSALVADATGSGKTRMGAQLVRAIRDQLWSSGRARRDLTVLVCPPAVRGVWKQEAVHCGLALTTVSHGVLSQSASETERHEHRAVHRAEILAVDEAHNFLNRDATRTRRLRQSVADHVVLFTATPISRGAADLLHLVALLGADNFEDETLDVLARLERRRDDVLTAAEGERLRHEIQRFTVRRTKHQINELVDREPNAYMHKRTGRVCRFPQHSARIYPTGESEQDQQVANRIRELAHGLKGIVQLPRRFAVPPGQRPFVTDEQWVRQRVGAARGLAVHHVLTAMRSSRSALVEHISGTIEASRRFSLSEAFKQVDTGDVLGRVTRLSGVGPPELELESVGPTWLTDVEQWAATCDSEHRIYAAILDAVLHLTPHREEAKCALLAELATRHDRLLAFDRYLITLSVLAVDLAQRLGSSIPVLVATGGGMTSRRRLIRDFGPHSEVRGVALCSDAMNEGLNLQGASAVLHLDLPTTLRVAEQRVGRVDRMDTPHEAIEVWWPQDGPTFATRAGERLAARAAEAEHLLGSNLPLPHFDGVDVDDDSVVDVKLLVEAEATDQSSWDGLRDAFEPVRSLVRGEGSLVPTDVYAAYRHITERVIARVAPIRSHRPWAFFAIRASDDDAPRWLLVDAEEPPAGELDVVALQLRSRLTGDPPSCPLDEAAMASLDAFLEVAARAEQELLPRRLRRALHQMRDVLDSWSSTARAAANWETADRWAALLSMCESEDDVHSRPDPHLVAEGWLKLVTPMLDVHRARRRRLPYTLLRDITPALRRTPMSIDVVEAQFASMSPAAPFAERVSACILGVPECNLNQSTAKTTP
jgi:hypothetical protein